MSDSLRARLLLMHALTVAAVVIVFAASVGIVTWQTRVAMVDDALERRAAHLVGAIALAPDGRIDVNLGPGLRPEDAPEVAHAIWDAAGQIVDRSPDDVMMSRPTAPWTGTIGGRRQVVRAGPAGVLVQVSSGLATVKSDVAAVAATLGVTGGIILLISVLAGRWLAGRALEPLDRISRTAAQMIGGDLSARIAVDSDSDIGRLGHAVNGAFQRLQAAVDRQRRFTADASHELRTPLTTLSTEIQWAQAGPRTTEELRRSIDVCRRAVDRMQAVTSDLLHLARAEAAATRPVALDLAGMVAQAVDRIRPLAAELTITLRPVPATIEADLSQTEAAIANVLTNAVRYNVAAGRVDVTMERTGDRVELTVADTGVGISAADLPLVFEPFFRGDPARSRDTGGTGLGLALTRAAVEQAGGTIRVDSAPGVGTRVVLAWPISVTPAAPATGPRASVHPDPRPEPKDREARLRPV
jgi:two-component system OmpR family sensor kinase